jgi:hypothetical protein
MPVTTVDKMLSSKTQQGDFCVGAQADESLSPIS